MSKPRLRRLGVLDLHRLPRTCESCVLGSTRTPGLESGSRAAPWARAAEADWGLCGVGMFHVEHVVGYVLLASPLHVPRPHSGHGLSPDAAVIMSLRVLPAYAGCGVGRQLIQAAAARIARTSLRALEACGTYGPGMCALPPAGFLEAVGFAAIDAHSRHPRLRLELARTARWAAPGLRTSMEHLLTWIRPLPPAPANRSEHRSSLAVHSH